MGAGASVWQGNRRELQTLFNARVGSIIANGHSTFYTALQARFALSPDTDTDMEMEEDIPYWEPYEGPLVDSPVWEPITNTRGGLFEAFDDDWIPDFETESDN